VNGGGHWVPMNKNENRKFKDLTAYSFSGKNE
jgi:hypothetical protein